MSYLTDFYVDEKGISSLAHVLKGCDVMVCESHYAHAENHLAKKNFHMTAQNAAILAREAEAKKLILFHFSDRYDKEGLLGMINDARSIFPEVYFPLLVKYQAHF